MLKRAYLSLKQQPMKTIILFLIFLSLSALTAGVLVIREAIQVTEVNLHRQIPPVATILTDVDLITDYWELNGEWPQMDSLSSEILNTIGEIPYVHTFDYSIWSEQFFSGSLDFPMRAELYDPLGFSKEGIRSMLLPNIIGDELKRFTIHGVANPIIADIAYGNLQLVDGRVFTESEIEKATPVAVVSREFALVNELSVGDYFSLDIRIHDPLDTPGVFDQAIIYLEHEPTVRETVSLEIIGLFEPILVIDEDTSYVHAFAHVHMNTRIYTPLGIAMQSQNMWLAHLEQNEPDRMANYGGVAYQDILFVLENSIDLAAFYEAASEIIPEFWLIDDLRREFGAATGAMSSLQGIANGVFIGVAFASALVVPLIILLFLRERRHEIGVYMALGEKRLKIIAQLLTEILIISSVAVTFSLFVGYRLSETLATQMLRTELVNNPDVMPNDSLIIRGGSDFNHMGFSTLMTGEEMFQAFSITLDGQTIMLFYGYSLLLLVVGTSIPTLYLLKLKPKDLLISF